MHYLRGGSGAPTKGVSLELFGIIAPQMLQLLFYIPWYGALITLAAIGLCVFVAIRTAVVSRFALVLLGSWLGLGLLITLVYAATPGAGNSPRIFLPALPPLALLFAAGFAQLGSLWRRRIAIYLVGLFTVVNLVAIGYYAVQGAEIRSYMPAWQILRNQPRGFVLTEQYWTTILFARQPATWFEGDEVFEHNIMRNRANFARYVEANPIRYVIVPQNGSLVSDDVRAYLDTNAKRVDAGATRLYVLRDATTGRQ